MYLKYFKHFLPKMRTPHNECASFSFKVKQIHALFMRFHVFLPARYNQADKKERGQ